MIRIDNEHLDIAAIADSGQTFRFNRAGTQVGADGRACEGGADPVGGQTYELRAGARRVYVSQDIPQSMKDAQVQTGDGENRHNARKSLSIPKHSEKSDENQSIYNCAPVYLDCSQEEYDGFWKNYFDLQTDYGAFLAAIPPEDEFLVAAGRAAGGIRILRQDPWEMLISFLISQRKNIPAIKSCIEKISSRFGTEGAFPTIEELAGASRDELAECSLGYRTDYVLEAARAAAEGKLDLYAMKEMPDEELRARLLEIKGVGVKVANCVMLFGYHRIAAFPIDVWIARIIKEQYGGTFPVERYEGFAGVIQQYMFYYGRSGVFIHS